MDNKYQYTDKCREISGFGGEYEDTCRKMVIQGIEWLTSHSETNPAFRSLKNVIGLCFSENEDGEALHTAMTAGFEGLTGAMVHTCTNHVLAANKIGWEKYIEEMEKQEKE